MWRKCLAAALLVLTTGVASAAANTDAELRLNELLGDPQYRQTWQKLIQDENRLPEWLVNLSGEATPMRAVQSDDGKRYLLGKLCEPQHCANQRLYVAFSWNKDEAYGLYVQVPQGLPADKSPSRHATKRWLGEPDEKQQRLLEEQLKSDSDWY